MGQIEAERKPGQRTDAPPLGIGSRFKGYGPEIEISKDKAEIRADMIVQQLMDAFRKTECLYPTQYLEVFDDPYDSALENLKGISYSAEDVQGFTIALAELQGEEGYSSKKAGLFLSALVNNGEEQDYTIFLRHLETPIHCLAYKNTKNIIVEGDVGNTFGTDFQEGTATIKGDAGTHTGMIMEGGSIIIEGSVDFGLGMGRKGGSIIVKGDKGKK